MTAWYLLFVAQTFLVRFGRSRLHQRLGITGAYLAACVVVTGIHATLQMPRHHVSADFPISAHLEQLPFLGIVAGNLVTLVFFAGLVGAALVLRRRPLWHSRLMFWAFVLSVGPAFGGGGTRPLGPLVAPLFGLFPPCSSSTRPSPSWRSRLTT